MHVHNRHTPPAPPPKTPQSGQWEGSHSKWRRQTVPTALLPRTQGTYHHRRNYFLWEKSKTWLSSSYQRRPACKQEGDVMASSRPTPQPPWRGKSGGNSKPQLLPGERRVWTPPPAPDGSENRLLRGSQGQDSPAAGPARVETRGAGIRVGALHLLDLRLSFCLKGRPLIWHICWGQLWSSWDGGWQAPPLRALSARAPAVAPSSHLRARAPLPPFLAPPPRFLVPPPPSSRPLPPFLTSPPPSSLSPPPLLTPVSKWEVSRTPGARAFKATTQGHLLIARLWWQGLTFLDLGDSSWQAATLGTAGTAQGTPLPVPRKRPIRLSWNLGWGAGFGFGPELGAQGPALREQRPVPAIISALDLRLFTVGSISQTGSYTLTWSPDFWLPPRGHLWMALHWGQQGLCLQSHRARSMRISLYHIKFTFMFINIIV